VRRLIPVLGALAALLTACSAPSQGPQSSPTASTAPAVPGYRLVADLPLPGNGSRWAYSVLDARSGRLYLAHQGTGQIVVVDTAQQRVVTTVPGVDSVQGLALSGTGRLYATATARDQVAVIDTASGRVVDRVSAGGGPDGLTYVSSSSRLFVSDGRDGGEMVVDATSDRPRMQIGLGPGPADSQFDPWTGRVLVTIAGSSELVAIDPATERVVARYPLPGCQGADGLAVDVATQDRAFVSCGGNARLLCVDLGTGQSTSSLGVGTGPDLMALDLALHRLYVASESGVLTVIDTAGTDPLVLTHGLAGRGAHSVAVDPNTHLVYLPLPGPGGRSVLRVLAPAPDA
jgi:DNA-binding beta-propeller fold protein YncE